MHTSPGLPSVPVRSRLPTLASAGSTNPPTSPKNCCCCRRGCSSSRIRLPLPTMRAAKGGATGTRHTGKSSRRRGLRGPRSQRADPARWQRAGRPAQPSRALEIRQAPSQRTPLAAGSPGFRRRRASTARTTLRSQRMGRRWQRMRWRRGGAAARTARSAACEGWTRARSSAGCVGSSSVAHDDHRGREAAPGS
jgi:hypothetical protein